MLVGIESISIDTLALTLAHGSTLSVGGPALLRSPGVYIPCLSAISHVITYRNVWTQPIQPKVQVSP